jgi:hypothetical protein
MQYSWQPSLPPHEVPRLDEAPWWCCSWKLNIFATLGPVVVPPPSTDRRNRDTDDTLDVLVSRFMWSGDHHRSWPNLIGTRTSSGTTTIYWSTQSRHWRHTRRSRLTVLGISWSCDLVITTALGPTWLTLWPAVAPPPSTDRRHRDTDDTLVVLVSRFLWPADHHRSWPNLIDTRTSSGTTTIYWSTQSRHWRHTRRSSLTVLMICWSPPLLAQLDWHSDE